jgi:hypothetical protein
VSLRLRATTTVLGALAVIAGRGFRAGPAGAFVFRVSVTKALVSRRLEAFGRFLGALRR